MNLPFDVELEERPPWVRVSTLILIFVSVFVMLKLAPMIALVPFLVASSLGRRFGSTAVQILLDDEGLLLGREFVPRSAIYDVWLDPDEVDARVVLAAGPRMSLIVLSFPNREQARRFADAFPEPKCAVAGHRPRLDDILVTAQFVAIALAFLATGSWFGLLAFIFVGRSARAVVAAKQLVVLPDAIELRSLVKDIRTPIADIMSVDVEEGILRRHNGPDLRFARPNARDALLATPPWAESLRRRALKSAALARTGTIR